jgi:aconitase A
MMVVPGSQLVKRQAEGEGLREIFEAAGAEWREAGCSMCIAMNGDQLAPGRVCREHQQPQLRGPAGQGGRTFLASPLTAVASAVSGRVADARDLVKDLEPRRRRGLIPASKAGVEGQARSQGWLPAWPGRTTQAESGAWCA